MFMKAAYSLLELASKKQPKLWERSHSFVRWHRGLQIRDYSRGRIRNSDWRFFGCLTQRSSGNNIRISGGLSDRGISVTVGLKWESEGEGGLEAHEELIFIHRLLLVGSNDQGIIRRHGDQIEYFKELI